jgi:hypothetical protein
VSGIALVTGADILDNLAWSSPATRPACIQSMPASPQPFGRKPMSRTSPEPRGAETPLRRSLSIYLALMVYLVLVKIVLGLASVKGVLASQDELFAWQLIGLLALAGGISVWLGSRAGLPDLWDASIPTRRRLLFPALVGVGLGVVFLTVQAFTGFVQVVAAAQNVSSINVPFPASLLFYTGAAIILETLYRLILITLPFWLIANAILHKRGQTPVFWVVALLASALEPATQMSFVGGHLALMLVVGGATYAINVFEAHLLRRYGFLAPLALRLGYYLVWHIAGGALGA